MKKVLGIMLVCLLVGQVSAQKFITKSGFIKFYSETPMETIEADNKTVNSAYDHKSGMIVFKVLIKSFHFEKALMQEHFNENYMESDEFPSATFKGSVINNSEIDLAKQGEVEVELKGMLSIHGVKKEIETKGIMNIKEASIHATAKFDIKPADYDIKIPGAVVKNIAETIEVTVDVDLKQLKSKR